MPERDTSTPGPVANFVFASIWLGLGIWTASTPGPTPLRWAQLAGYLVMAGLFIGLGVRKLRARRASR